LQLYPHRFTATAIYYSTGSFFCFTVNKGNQKFQDKKLGFRDSLQLVNYDINVAQNCHVCCMAFETKNQSRPWLRALELAA
jgi:hypothetical protein